MSKDWRDAKPKFRQRVLQQIMKRMIVLWNKADQQMAQGVDQGAITDTLEECSAFGGAIAALQAIVDDTEEETVELLH